MTNYNCLFCLLLFCTLVIPSCKKQDLEQTRYLTFRANASYSGLHDTSKIESNIYLIEKKFFLQFQTDLIGINYTKNYSLQIYAYDTTQTYGYSADPVIDLGIVSGGRPTTVQNDLLTFEEFTQNFKGYYIVHDPDNISADTSTLLIYSKIGGGWQ